MLEDISIYRDTKRNDICPCGSEKRFKKCCLKEYREARKSGKSAAKLSCFTPIPQLSKDFKEKFTTFYIDLMLFSKQYRDKSEVIIIDDIDQNIQGFIQQERAHFYKQSKEIVESYIADKNPSDDELEILNSLRDTKYDEFFLISKSENSAIIMDKDEQFYNITALHSPFTEIFNLKKRYLGLNTVLIPYKNCYITDGIYGGFDVTEEMNKYFDNVPYTNPMIRYNKKNSVTNIPLVLNFTIGSQVDKFEMMEDTILTKISEKFTKSFLKLFKNQYSHKEQLISSFLRSTDLEKELNSEEGEQAFSLLIGGAPITNFEFNGDNDVINYEILQKYYQQSSLKDSTSKSVYDNVQKNKNAPNKKQMIQSSFYSMLGMIHIDDDLVDDLIEFLKTFNDKEKREEIALGVDTFFKELSDEVGFDISAIYLGSGIDLDFIYHDIEDYREYMKDNNLMTLDDAKQYAFRD